MQRASCQRVNAGVRDGGKRASGAPLPDGRLGVRPHLSLDLNLSLGETGLAASPLDSPAHVHTPRQRSSPTGLQMSCLSQNGTPELSPRRGKTRAERLQQLFCAVFCLSVGRQGPCPTLILPLAPALCPSQTGDDTPH